MSKRRLAQARLRAQRPSERPVTDECVRCHGDGYTFDRRLLRRRCSCVWAALVQSNRKG